MTVRLGPITAYAGLDRIGRDAWDIADESGWHDTLRWRVPACDAEDARHAFGIERLMTNLALIHSEVSEAVEALRKHPEEFGEELADIVIRTLELAHMAGVHMGTTVMSKMVKNRSRLDVPARSGGKAI